jgi:hypothetical protein
MKITVKVDDIRPAWRRAKYSFAENWAGGYGVYGVFAGADDRFFTDFGYQNNMECIIEGHNLSFPIINVVQFKDEKAYAWFLLRWG